jgi:sugar lactone lactonase YvrE
MRVWLAAGVAAVAALVVAGASGVSTPALEGSDRITTFAGTGVAGSLGLDGPATSAQLFWPTGVAVDGQGNLYIADQANNRVLKVVRHVDEFGNIIPGGIITTFAGTGVASFSGDNGPAKTAQLNTPVDVAVDGQGNVYIADYRNNRVRKVDPGGIITTVAGGGTLLGDGGPATSACLAGVLGVALDGGGNLFIATRGNTACSQRIRKVNTSGIISTIAGTGVSGYSGDGGPATAAKIDPEDVAVDAQGNVYIADIGSDRVRKVDGIGIISTFAGSGAAGFAGDGGPATVAQLNEPYGVTVDGQGNLYIADFRNDRVRRVDAGGTIATIAGGGSSLGDGGPATSAQLCCPTNVALDPKGNLYIADYQSERVRWVDAHSQTITFAALANKTYEDPDFSISATASSGLAVSFDAIGDCSLVTATTVHILRAGSCAITAKQVGNADWTAAPEVTRSFLINKANQAITVTTHAPMNAGLNTGFTVAATAPGGAVTYSSSGACTNVGATFTTASSRGICTVNYDQAGSTNYNKAPELSDFVTVQGLTQEITVTTHAPSNAGLSTIFTVAATAPGGPVTYSSAGACTNSGATFTTASSSGTCTVKYDQAGSTTYEPAPQKTDSVTVGKLDQTITFAALASKTYGDPDFAVSATASSQLTVTFAALGNCSMAASATVRITGAGSCTVTASQAGNTNVYNAATPVSRTFSIAKASQAITVSVHAPTSAAANTTFAVSATAPGGSVSYSESSGACTNSGSFFTTTSSAGTCTVRYDQAGNTNYNAATQIAESVTVTAVAAPKSNQTITFGALSSKTYGDADFGVSASASSGLAVSFAAGGNCTVSGSAVHVTGAGSCTITASQTGNASFNAAADVARTFSIAKAAQTITFGPLANKSNGDPDFAVGASASSGLTVAFTASGNCTVSATTVHITGAGSCTVTASQPGNVNYNAATPASQTFSIGPFKPLSTCKVPKLVGTTLAAAKRAITRAGCRAGNVTYTYSSTRKKGTVISQSRRAGSVVAANSTLDLVISSGPVPKAVLNAHITNNCTRVTARLLLARNRLGDLGDPKLRDPVGQVLCGTFFGKRSRGMAVSLAIPSCGRTGGWVVFRWNGRAWKLVMRQKHGADLAAIGSLLRETQFIFLSRDTHCNPSGGTRSRTWRWNGSRFVASRWQRSH